MGKIRLAGIVPESYTDGDGIRYTIFVQGCAHQCTNCQNKSTWDFNGGRLYEIDDIINEIMENPLLDGITLSGGDPMYQTSNILELIDKLHNRLPQMTIWLYTGFTYEECLTDNKKRMVLEKIDIIVDGEYIDSKRDLTKRFKGSTNQRIIDVKKSLTNNKIVLFIDE